MISALAFTFVMLPCMAATAVAAVVRDWRVAVVAFIGALAAFAGTAAMPQQLAVLALPMIVGAILGLFFVNFRLWMAKTERAAHPDIWSRMLWALIPTFTITFVFLLIAVNGA